MSSPLAVYKLIILYLLDKTDGEIAMDRLSSFLLEKGYVNFVSLMETYAQIEESGLVSTRVSGDRCFYSITSEGRQTLKLFNGQLGRDIKKQLLEKCLENRKNVFCYDNFTVEEYRDFLDRKERRIQKLA